MIREFGKRGMSRNAFLTVTVSGPPKSGKSTLAVYLADVLKGVVYGVRLCDPDHSEKQLAVKLKWAKETLKGKCVTILSKTEAR